MSNPVKLYIPHILIFSRLVLGLLILLFSIMHIAHYAAIAITLLTVGLLTDIFDGIVARQLHVSTVQLRRLDSTIDQLFFISFAVATYIACPDFFLLHKYKILLLFGVECLTYVVSFVKFRKEIATHSIGAKIWTLFLFAALIQITAQCSSDLLFNLCIGIGIITRIEIIAILLLLKTWTSDVPTFVHALKLRRGKEIKRHKLFNG